jgi:glycerol kinase
MQEHGLFLAIDQSTSATKVMLFTSFGQLLDQESLSHQQIYPFPGWVEHNAEEIYINLLKTAARLINRNMDKQAKILALSITNQRETFVVFDRQTGHPLHNAIVWQCRRGNDFCDFLMTEGYEEFVHELTGLKIDTYFPASKLHWLLENHSGLKKKLKDGSALFGTIETYLIYRLTNGKVYASDHTNASRTLLYDLEKLAWNKELSEIFGLEFNQMPELRESSTCFGETDLEGCLDKAIPICGVMGDSQAALLGQRGFKAGAAKVTFGTGSSVLLNIGNEKRLSNSGSVTALAWVIGGKPTYAFEGIINCTGGTITWLRDQLHLIDDPSETEELAKTVVDCGGVYFVPAFVGLSAPYWRPDARAAILGMTPATTKAHVVRAALESIGYVVTDVLREMCEDAGVEPNIVHADGGATRNSFLMQFVADMNQLKVRASQMPELSALGAVFCGVIGMNLVDSIDELLILPFNFTEYQASMSPDLADELYSGWQLAVKQVLSKNK